MLRSEEGIRGKFVRQSPGTNKQKAVTRKKGKWPKWSEERKAKAKGRKMAKWTEERRARIRAVWTEEKRGQHRVMTSKRARVYGKFVSCRPNAEEEEDLYAWVEVVYVYSGVLS